MFKIILSFIRAQTFPHTANVIVSFVRCLRHSRYLSIFDEVNGPHPSHHLKPRACSKNAIRQRHELVDVHRAGSPVYVVRLAWGRVRSFADTWCLSDIIILTAEETNCRCQCQLSCDFVTPFKLHNNIMFCLTF
jgi:hypothetical protein